MTEQQTFDIEKLEATHLPELQGLREKQLQIVRENPFVKVEDATTYETAKKARTTLVSASFNLNFGGQEISGETSGKMNFQTTDKQEEKNTKETHKIHTTYQTQITYQTVTTYKSVLKNKQTERKAFPVWVWILTGVLLTVLAQILWSRVKPKFNFF